MKPNLTTLTKAAILLASLDDETADGLLAQMAPDQAARVRREMFELGDIDPEVQRHVVAEFRRGERPPRDPYPAGIELDSGLAERIARSEASVVYGPPAGAPAVGEEAPPFRFLHQAEADTLVEYLRHERPQTIALVLSHLSASQAVEIIDRLAPAAQAQVLRRLAELDEADPSVLRDVERHLESWVRQQMRTRDRRQAGLQALTAILSAAASGSRQQIAANLARHDRSLAEMLGFDAPSPAHAAVPAPKTSDAEPPARNATIELRFTDLMDFDDERLGAVVDAAASDVLVLALAGANAAFVERVVSCLSGRNARLLRRALKHLGPTRLSDVEEAQQALADLAAELRLAARRRDVGQPAAAMVA